MATTKPIKEKLQDLKKEYDTLRQGKDSLLVLVDEAEVAEAVYNSNAIENSTLTLKETEKILLEMEVARDVSVREGPHVAVRDVRRDAGAHVHPGVSPEVQVPHGQVWAAGQQAREAEGVLIVFCI